ncbi:hypothetical protein [Haladaptatus halobius]|nr:hypothetical protein [Haladaptatus halobius]
MGRARFEHTVGRAHSVARNLPAIQIAVAVSLLTSVRRENGPGAI